MSSLGELGGVLYVLFDYKRILSHSSKFSSKSCEMYWLVVPSEKLGEKRSLEKDYN